jgi:hypothetical protein
MPPLVKVLVRLEVDLPIRELIPRMKEDAILKPIPHLQTDERLPRPIPMVEHVFAELDEVIAKISMKGNCPETAIGDVVAIFVLLDQLSQRLG